jgi:hypothetical protein
MPRRHRSAGRRSRGSLARHAVPIAIPVALVVAVGAVVAIADHSGTNNVTDAANANCASPAAYVVPANAAGLGHQGTGGTAPPTVAASSTATPTTSASVTATPTTAATATATVTPTATASSTATPTATASSTATPTATASSTATPTATASSTATPTAAAAGTAAATPTSSASAMPCSSVSAAPSTTSTATTTAANVNCDIIVPRRALTAQGLATPYQLTGTDGTTPDQSGCTMANAANLGAFVQATILNPATGQLFVYDPLVITQGTTPAVAPVVPRLPRNAIVTIDFGFNGTDLTQVGAGPYTLRNANCVNGLDGTDFGQVSFCNGTNFFNAAFRLEREGKLVVPSAGTSTQIVASGGNLGTGQTCPTTRNFDMVDQDQSDNVTSFYLLNPATGQTAQDTTANAGNLTGATTLANGSDDVLVDAFLDPTLGCTPFMAPDLANNYQPATSQALNELLAAKNQLAITALVPENDEMTLDGNGNFDAAKTNLYRAEVGQAPISNWNNQNDSPAMYCQNLVNIQTPFLAANQTLLATGTSPVPGVGSNLLTFMANRLSMSFINLGCQNFGLTDPVTVTLDGNGAAVAATFDTTTQTVANTTATATATATPSATTPPATGHRGWRHHHQVMDPSGM